MRRFFGVLILLAAVLATVGELMSSPGHRVLLPSVSAIFSGPVWLGWVMVGLLFVFGGWLLHRKDFHFSPMTWRRLQRFQSIGRGAWSLRILMVLVIFAGFDQIVAGKRALVVKYEGQWFFPAFQEEIQQLTDFGREGEGEPNYRVLKEAFRDEGKGNFVIMPLIPWAPTYDTDDAVKMALREEDGRILNRKGKPYSGLAVKFDPELKTRLRQVRVRNAQFHLFEEVFDEEGNLVRRIAWEHGKRGEVSDLSGNAAATEQREESGWMEVDYMPISPNWERRHYLGTTSKGWDVAAQLYGGFQIILQAVVFFLLATYLVGISIGLIMGFFGGWFDIVVQRLIEVIAAIPFLYVVIILVSIIGKDNVSVGIIVAILCFRSWIGCSYYMRTATFREKGRDYIAAARVLGAGPGRIVFKHILPNTLAILVTLIPFSVTSVSTSLTALDFIGFGIADKYPSWGRLLGDGVEYLRTAPWIVISVFASLVTLLLLVTFVGEALREAFDPKKFTTYK